MCDYCSCRSMPVIEELGAVERLNQLDEDAWDGMVVRLLDDLHEHIGREEYDLFPAALVALAPIQWDAVEKAAREVRLVAT